MTAGRRCGWMTGRSVCSVPVAATSRRCRPDSGPRRKTPMCGIAGILKFEADQPVEYPRLDRMRTVMRHRGPDDSSIVIRGRAGLAQTRLSIIELAGGQHPMAGGGSHNWISYN